MIKIVLACALGGLLGFAYHKLVGCASGGCPITANPYTSILYGGLVGCDSDYRGGAGAN